MKELILENVAMIKYLFFYAIIIIVGILLYKFKRDWFEKIYKHRFMAGGILLLFCVLIEISGSSIGCFSWFISGGDVIDEGIVLGESRQIRSDEWAANTLMAFSQEYNKPKPYSYISDTIRGDKTDTFIVYGQPVWNIGIIYRPFQIGYLLFGSAKGLSFFWYSRLIALFLVSFEMMMLITKNKRGLSAVGTMLIAFAPIVSWWIAVNGIVEILVAGMAAIILLHKFMTSTDFKKRVLYLIGIAICAGTYLLVFYPAWQIPIFYIILGLALWVFLENFKTCKITKKDIIAIIIVLLLFITSIIYIFMKSSETISYVINTVYPGARCELGGNAEEKYINYPSNFFLCMKTIVNPCERAVFIDLFPVGLILAAVVFWKYKKKDKLLIILLSIFVFLSIYCMIGFPKILAKLTLLSNSQAKRAILATGFINVLILIRSMALMEKSFRKRTSFLISLLLAVSLMIINKMFYPDYFGYCIATLSGSILFVLFYLCFRYQSSKICKYLFVILITFVMCLSGGIVNPIRKGIDVVHEQPVVKAIKEINDKQPGRWIVEDLGYPIINLPMTVGASTVNSTNVYPNLERWRKFDENREYEEIYNRYAHIIITLVKEKTNFELVGADMFRVNLNVEDLKILEVNYILTAHELENFDTENTIFTLLYTENGYRIYEVNYN